MSYDISLKDPVTGETIELKEPHFMRGGTYAVGGTTELWLNITYNYASYYYDATDGDPRFAHEEVSAYYADGTQSPMQTEYGIRGIYGKTGAESIPMLEDMIRRIEDLYMADGEWMIKESRRPVAYDANGNRLENALSAMLDGRAARTEEEVYTVSEGDTSNYREATAANAIRPLHQLIAFARMRPDGVWDGD